MLPALIRAITKTTGIRSRCQPVPVAGGCIHRAWRLGSLFVKTNHASFVPMFEAEADALRTIAATDTLRVPAAIAWGATGEDSFLALEWLDLHPTGNERLLGTQLAALHQTTSPVFGWHRDNTLGSTPQPNPPTPDWLVFFRNHRLGHMFRLLEGQGTVIPGADTLLDRVDRFYPEGPPRPALLHGDLWGGNCSYLADGTPVIFDPACWFGDPESDIAMTRLFGGLGAHFHQSYRAACGRPAMHPRLHELHQLYHILNHALLFGGSYVSRAKSLTRALAGVVA